MLLPYSYHTPDLPTNIVDFRGFDSSIILKLRGGILGPIGNFTELLSQAMLDVSREIGRNYSYQTPATSHYTPTIRRHATLRCATRPIHVLRMMKNTGSRNSGTSVCPGGECVP